jgi:beta-lactamase class A
MTTDGGRGGAVAPTQLTGLEESEAVRLETLSLRLENIASTCPEVTWGMSLRCPTTGQVLGEYCADVVLSTASVGKVLLLIEAARLMEDNELQPGESLDCSHVSPVADSGLWQHLMVKALPAQDVCVLIGALSDNLATNVLLRRIGLDRVKALAEELNLRTTALHDSVRDVRGSDVPERLSSGSAAELTQLFTRLHQGTVVMPAVSERVRRWLAIDADLSMASSVFNLDPLSHQAPDRGIDLMHKTGTDAGVRADAGIVIGEGRAVAYAVLANWPKSEDRRDEVHAAMRLFGDELLTLVPPVC